MERVIKRDGVQLVVRPKTAFEDDFLGGIWLQWKAALAEHFKTEELPTLWSNASYRLVELYLQTEVVKAGFLPNVDIWNPSYETVRSWVDIMSKQREFYSDWVKAVEELNKEQDSPLSENSEQNGDQVSEELLETVQET